MIRRLSFFLGGIQQLNNEIEILLLQYQTNFPDLYCFGDIPPLIHFLHRASENTDMIGKSRTELPTNAIKAANKTTLHYEVGL